MLVYNGALELRSTMPRDIDGCVSFNTRVYLDPPQLDLVYLTELL